MGYVFENINNIENLFFVKSYGIQSHANTSLVT